MSDIDLAVLPEVLALNPRHSKFVLSYIVSGNQSKAYRDAYLTDGKTIKNPSVLGNTLLKNVKIISALNACKEAIAKYNNVTVEWIVEQLRSIASNKEENSSDRIRCLELLGKYKGMFKESSGTQIAIFSDKIGQQLVESVRTPALEVDTIEVINEGEVRATPQDPL